MDASSGNPMISKPNPPIRPPIPEVALIAKARMENTTPSARRPVLNSYSSATSTNCESITMGTTGSARKPKNRLPNNIGTSQAESFSGKKPIIRRTCGRPISVAQTMQV